MRQGGHPTLELNVSDVQPNSAAALEVRGNPARGGGPPAGPGAPAAGGVRIQPEKIADGLWFLTSGAPQTILVEFNDHVVLIEAPSNDDRTTATIAEVRQMLPNKPIRYLVNTHHHSDHAGGIRAYVAKGIPIITHETHRSVIQRR